MQNRAAIIGAGVSGLTCGVVFAEREWKVTIFADETGQQTTSATAAAVWFPYDVKSAEKIIPWALTTYERLRELARDAQTGVSMIEIRQFTRTGEIPVPAWAKNLGACRIPTEVGAIDLPLRLGVAHERSDRSGESPLSSPSASPVDDSPWRARSRSPARTRQCGSDLCLCNRKSQT
jgi:glycine/D-amino acid oxidase-like deaminating enzyme